MWEFYDELERICTETVELRPIGPVVALNVPAGQWYTVKALEWGSGDLGNEGRAYEPTRGRISLRCEFTVSANTQRSGTWDSNANSSASLEV